MTKTAVVLAALVVAVPALAASPPPEMCQEVPHLILRITKETEGGASGKAQREQLIGKLHELAALCRQPQK